MSAEHARRPIKPRYVPQAPRRSIPVLDPDRAEKMHPTWCPCPACNHETPAERPRLSGCNIHALGIFAGIALAIAAPLLGALAPSVLKVLVAAVGIAGPGLLIFGKHFK